MKSLQFLTTILLFLIITNITAQVGINNSNPHESAALDITSTTGGLLIPRMTNAERLNISEPTAGLQVFVTDFDGGVFMFYDGTKWGTLSFTKTNPNAPNIVNATAGNGFTTVSYTAPSSDGGSAITSYTATSNPGDITGTLTQSGSGNITVPGLTNGTTYTFTVTATNAIGTSAASAASNSVTPVESVLAIGGTYQGGIIFYLDGSGGGLIAAPSDQSSAEWGCYGQFIGINGTPGTSSAVGTGAANTTATVSGCSVSYATAAKICADLTLGGYDDWFLPSLEELSLMYYNIGLGSSLGNIGNFAWAYYWSSTQYNSNGAWCQYFGNGNQFNHAKYSTNSVRAVRAF
jgi:hypothetical protein